MSKYGTKNFLNYSVHLKDMFFDREMVERAIDEYQHGVLKWFGGQVRKDTRKYLGKPNIQGRLQVIQRGKNKGKTKRVTHKKPRAPGRPPIPRVDDSTTVTLRNIQYVPQIDLARDDARVQIFGIRFPRTSRYTRAQLSAPELHEFGGTIKARAKIGTIKGKTGKPTKQKMLYFNRSFPFKSFRIPKRPYLLPTFDKVVAEADKRAAEGRKPFKLKGM
jgi:hypothetical protein